MEFNMNKRIYKKLCKKAAQAMSFKGCNMEEGIYHVSWQCGGLDDEWDSEDTYPYLTARFDGSVNTVIDYDSECGISWKPKNQCSKATPKNVLKWAMTQKQFNSFI
jgi:hypothetical protein